MNEPVPLFFVGGYALRAWVLFVYQRQVIVAGDHHRICHEIVYQTLLNLWLDAKERELRDRAGKS